MEWGSDQAPRQSHKEPLRRLGPLLLHWHVVTSTKAAMVNPPLLAPPLRPHPCLRFCHKPLAGWAPPFARSQPPFAMSQPLHPSQRPSKPLAGAMAPKSNGVASPLPRFKAQKPLSLRATTIEFRRTTTSSPHSQSARNGNSLVTLAPSQILGS